MPEPVQVAFRVYGTDWGMTRGHGSRQVDWLIDGHYLHRDNTVFVIDQRISRAYRQALEAKYRVYDASRWRPFGDEGARWRRFLDHWRPKHFVSYNDVHPRHTMRNAILKWAGCQTWMYTHSVHDDGAYGKPVEDEWRNLDYDHIVNWGERDARLTPGPQHHVLGPLFSSLVPRKVLAVFDSTFTHPGPYVDGTEKAFTDGIGYLLVEHPDWIVISKPKLPRPEQVRERWYELPAWVNPDLVIACADLTISLAFTSTTIEALGAGRRAIFYDPLNAFPKHYYQDIPYFVAHNEAQLRAYVAYWLTRTDTVFHAWLEKYIAPCFGGHLDGNAAYRFRGLLT